MTCCMFSLMVNSGVGGIKGSLRMLSGFRSGEPLSIGEILGEGTRGNIEWLEKCQWLASVFP